MPTMHTKIRADLEYVKSWLSYVFMSHPGTW